MIVLGISDSFTSGASIVIDGRIAAAVNEERLNRNKMCMGFPILSIAEVMRLANVRPADLDAVAIATENLFWRPETVPYNDYYREEKGSGRDFYLSLGAAFSTVVGNSTTARKAYYGMKSVLTHGRQNKIVELLKEKFNISKPVQFVDHHLCHAASAYFTSGYEKATVITQDGAGDGKCCRVYRVQSGHFEEFTALDSYDSIGNYYSYVTHLCGYKAHKHEGKITGLAALGKPTYLGLLRKYIQLENGRIKNIGKCFDHSAIKKIQQELPPNFTHADLSASVQELLEETIATFCSHWINQTGIGDVVCQCKNEPAYT